MRAATINPALIQKLADGAAYSAPELCVACSLSTNELARDLEELATYGVDLLAREDCLYQLRHPLQLLDAQAIKSHSGGLDVEVLQQIDSTNEYLLERLAILKSGASCAAEYQTEGRGRRANRWVAPFGTNACLSTYWESQRSCAQLTSLSLAIGVEIATLLGNLGLTEIRLKWPNDLYLHGRKLGGILIETRSKHCGRTGVVVGLGLNLASRGGMAAEIGQPWISLLEAGHDLDRNYLIGLLANSCHQALKQFEQHHLAPFLERWNTMDYLAGRLITVATERGSTQGIVRGIDQNGAILLESQGQLHSLMDGSLKVIDG